MSSRTIESYYKKINNYGGKTYNIKESYIPRVQENYTYTIKTLETSNRRGGDYSFGNDYTPYNISSNRGVTSTSLFSKRLNTSTNKKSRGKGYRNSAEQIVINSRKGVKLIANKERKHFVEGLSNTSQISVSEIKGRERPRLSNSVAIYSRTTRTTNAKKECTCGIDHENNDNDVNEYIEHMKRIEQREVENSREAELRRRKEEEERLIREEEQRRIRFMDELRLRREQEEEDKERKREEERQDREEEEARRRKEEEIRIRREAEERKRKWEEERLLLKEEDDRRRREQEEAEKRRKKEEEERRKEEEERRLIFLEELKIKREEEQIMREEEEKRRQREEERRRKREEEEREREAERERKR